MQSAADSKTSQQPGTKILSYDFKSGKDKDSDVLSVHGNHQAIPSNSEFSPNNSQANGSTLLKAGQLPKPPSSGVSTSEA